MSKYKAIISDIDGTIAPLKWHAKPSDKVRNAIVEVQQKGITFSLATGKPFYLVEHLIDELGLTSPIIIDNGAAIYDTLTKEPLWESKMDDDIVGKIFTLAKQYNKRVRFSSGKNSVDVTEFAAQHTNITKILVMGLVVKDAEELIKTIEDNFKNVAVLRAQAHEGEGFRDIYVTNSTATKQHAVMKVAEILGIQTTEIIGIGDHYNDFPLLMACGLKVAMGNAVDDLKAIADYVAPSVNEDGVVDVIQKFIMR